MFVCVSFGTRQYHSIAHLRPTESMLVALDILEMLDLLDMLGHLPWLVIQIFTVRKGGWSFDPLPDCPSTAACLPYPEPLQTQEIERFSSCGNLRHNKNVALHNDHPDPF